MKDSPGQRDEGGVGETLRAAVERTLAATTPAAAQTRDRAAELVDEIARRGQEARDELARRGQGAQAELARQIEGLEKRLASIEELLRRSDGSPGGAERDPKPRP